MLKNPLDYFLQEISIGRLPITLESGENHQLGYSRFHGDPEKSRELPPLLWLVGRGEVSLEYANCIYQLRDFPIANDIYVMDLPGQGLSERISPLTPNIGNIDDFKSYARAINSMIQWLNSHHDRPPRIIAHSTGATALLLALCCHSSNFTESFQSKILLLSPFLGLNFRSLDSANPWIHNTLTTLLKAYNSWSPNQSLGSMESPIFLKGNLSTQKQNLIFINWVRTHLKEIFSLINVQKEIDTKSLFDQGAWVPGKSLHWVYQACRAMQIIRKKKQNLTPYTFEILLGELDCVVSNKASITLFKTHPSCQFTILPKAKHLLHQENSMTLQQVNQRILHFLE